MTSHKKSLMKTISWRIIASLTTAIITWMITGELSVALTVGGAEAIVKMGLYYLHERAWVKVDV